MTVIIFRWMEVYPEKMDGTYHIIRYASIHWKIVTVITYYLNQNALLMCKIQFDINVANRIAMDVANDILLVWWMEVYHFCFNQSKSVLPAKIKLLKILLLLTLLTVYFRFGGWRYTLFILTNQISVALVYIVYPCFIWHYRLRGNLDNFG